MREFQPSPEAWGRKRRDSHSGRSIRSRIWILVRGGRGGGRQQTWPKQWTCYLLMDLVMYTIGSA